MEMEKRRLGKSDLKVAPLAFGGNVFGWTADKPTSFQLLDAFVDAGFNLIDTANSYSRWVPGNQGGESERIIGNWLKKRGDRERIIIATKVGSDMGGGKTDLSRKHILEQVENSLRRLQTDYIDLYQSHYDDADTPIEETLETYAQLVKEGKVRAIGASNFSAERLTQALQISEQNGFPAYQSLQPEYNLYDRKQYESELAPLVREKGLGVISYFSLASGFLTGKYRSEADLSKSKRGGGIKKYLNERGFRILDALDEVAQQHGASPANIALAWLMARPGITAPIASATRLEQLEELIKASQVQLDAVSIEKLNKASEENQPAGA
jgi:aryl-alcohol dehydrogenase-like predicted oxidoreductase